MKDVGLIAKRVGSLSLNSKPLEPPDLFPSVINVKYTPPMFWFYNNKVSVSH